MSEPVFSILDPLASLLVAVNRSRLTEHVSNLPPETVREVEEGLRLVLAL